jgi:rhodanese-related sulfurtransferase
MGMMQVPTIEVSQLPDPLPSAVTVLDVRETVEWHHGRIDGAVHIPLGELPERRDEVPAEGQVLVVCTVGGRSAQATAYLKQLGVDAVNLDGGLLEWSAAGRPMVGDNEGEPLVV